MNRREFIATALVVPFAAKLGTEAATEAAGQPAFRAISRFVRRGYGDYCWAGAEFIDLKKGDLFRYTDDPTEYIAMSDARPCDPEGNAEVNATSAHPAVRSDAP